FRVDRLIRPDEPTERLRMFLRLTPAHLVRGRIHPVSLLNVRNPVSRSRWPTGRKIRLPPWRRGTPLHVTGIPPPSPNPPLLRGGPTAGESPGQAAPPSNHPNGGRHSGAAPTPHVVGTRRGQPATEHHILWLPRPTPTTPCGYETHWRELQRDNSNLWWMP